MPAVRLTHPPRRALVAATLPLLIGVLGACGYGSQAIEEESPLPTSGGKKLSVDEVKIGYFANVTHATPLVGVRDGGPIQQELGGTRATPQIFNAGPAEIEALNSGAIDIGWIGPSPAINGYVKSHGKNLKIISGSVSGGASLVVNPDTIRSVDDLKGKRIASPQLGNTQDVALLHYLREQGHRVDPETGRGDVSVLRQAGQEIPTTFQQGGVDGAWVPEPTASNLVDKGGKVLIDEKDLWDKGEFVTTNVIVSQEFLRGHPDVVEAVLRGSVRTNSWITAHPQQAKTVLNTQLTKLAGKPLPANVLNAAFQNVQVTNDPLATTLRAQAEHAVSAGLLERPRLQGIYDLRLLNKVLTATGEPTVEDAGLGS